MKVTGWTEWGDSNYIDIVQENITKRCEVMKTIPPLMNINEYKELSEENKKTYLRERKLAVDKAFEHYNRADEDLEKEIRKTVISELKEKDYHFFGEHHQGYQYGTPIIDNKYIYCVSMREWGSLMSEAYPNEDYQQYGECWYVKWAWYNDELKNQIKLPNNKKYKNLET